MNNKQSDNNNGLGKLENVAIRDIWKKEASDFTTWLAKEENLALLSDEIGVTINLIKTEAGVGAFSADILAEEANTGRKIVIENQLEETDHDHFGKLVTYGSGLDADILIWICKGVREEHRQAIDWLNEKTINTLGIFVIRMEVWKIGDSRPAPKFQVVCSPNDWSKTLKGALNNDRLSEIGLLQREFWSDFNTFMSKNRWFKQRKPSAQHWYDITIGNSQAHIAITVSFSKSFLRCELYINDNKELYHKLESARTTIENEFGDKLTWNESPRAKASTISIKTNIQQLKNRQSWDNCYKWYADNVEMFIKTFPKYLDS